MRKFKFLSLICMLAFTFDSFSKNKKKSTSKGKRKTEIEFQPSEVRGVRMNPLNSLVSQKAAQGYDFVKIRTNFKNEMVESTKSIEVQGKKLDIRN